jgi:hypothetical protein
MIRKIATGVLSIICSATLFAQGPPPGGPGHGGPGFGGPGFGGPGFGLGIGGPGAATVTGAPYSGQEIVQSVQTLANGNQLQRNDQINVYRDSQGRVRTESTTTPPGSSTAKTMITIVDPVAGYVTRLDPQTLTAVKTALPTGTPPTPPTPPSGSSAPQVVKEDLGTKTISGLVATGTRTTVTIPAGAMGNTAAIQSVRETWTSVDLQVPVSITSTDPRFGTSTFQLTNVTRTEPDASLFQVPATYTVTTRARPAGRGPSQ